MLEKSKWCCLASLISTSRPIPVKLKNLIVASTLHSRCVYVKVKFYSGIFIRDLETQLGFPTSEI